MSTFSGLLSADTQERKNPGLAQAITTIACVGAALPQEGLYCVAGHTPEALHLHIRESRQWEESMQSIDHDRILRQRGDRRKDRRVPLNRNTECLLKDVVFSPMTTAVNGSL